MRKASVLYKNQEAGELIQHDDGSFSFIYNEVWLKDSSKPGISLTFSKTKQEYTSAFLFPFFFNMIPEGSNKQVVCKSMRIDPTDHLSILLATAKHDTVGAVRVIQKSP